MSRIIKSLEQFKKVVVPNKKTDVYTGKTTKGYNLQYGFSGTGVFISASSISAAYEIYKDNYEKYDAYIPNTSFLKKKLKFEGIIRRIIKEELRKI